MPAREPQRGLDSRLVFWCACDAWPPGAGGAVLPIRNTLVFPASQAEMARAESTLTQAKFSSVASQFFLPIFFGCLRGTTWCPAAARVFYCQPFKGKPGASRGRKASGL
jgi:hypothetical protein